MGSLEPLWSSQVTGAGGLGALQAHWNPCGPCRSRRMQLAHQASATSPSSCSTSQAVHSAWNYSEFRVTYASLAPHLCVGGIYVRLLLEGSDTGAQAGKQAVGPLSFCWLPLPSYCLGGCGSLGAPYMANNRLRFCTGKGNPTVGSKPSIVVFTKDADTM